MESYKYTPKDVERLTGLSTLSQRERRLQRELKLQDEPRFQAYSFYFGGRESDTQEKDEFGKQQENKRWLFSRIDLIGIAISKILEDFVPERFEAERMAHWLTPQVAFALEIAGPDFMFAPGVISRNGVSDVYVDGVFRSGVPVTYGFFVKGQNPIFSDNATMGDILDEPCVYTVKIKKIAEQLPSELVARVKAENT